MGEPTIPNWLNSSFFTKVLQNCEEDASIEVLSFTTNPLKGAHYASVIFRSTVEYQQSGITKTKSMVTKTIPDAKGPIKQRLEASNVFETEIGIYTKILPKFEQILRDSGDDVKLAPLCLYHSLAPTKCLVLEDIVLQGYTPQYDRFLSFDEVKIMYSKMSKWHAVSHKIALDEPFYFDEYPHHMFLGHSCFDNPLTKTGLEYFISMLRSQSDLVKYVPYFETLSADHFLRNIEALDRTLGIQKANAMYVLCHGDFHSRNVMLKYNATDQSVQDGLLHDFQTCYMAPLVNDLMYSTYLMLSADDRVNRLDELLHFYFTTFQETLRKIKFAGSIPKIIDFHKLLMDHKNLELFLLIYLVPITYYIMDGSNFEDLLKDNANMKDLRMKDKYIADVRKMLPKFLYKGYLEA